MHGRRNGLISQLFTFCDPQIVVLDIFCPLPIRLQSPRVTGQLDRVLPFFNKTGE